MTKTLLCAMCLVLLTACSEQQQSLTATQSPSSTTSAKDCKDKDLPDPEQETDVSEAPKIEIPDGDPPCDLQIQDVKEGDGAKAEPGATVTIHYTGVFWSTGEPFDSSWDRGEPATFPLGDLIPGWQEGIPGMREGGRRRLTIPPELAYGVAGRPGIPPNSTLVFVIDLIEASA